MAIVKPRRDEVPQADDAFYLERASPRRAHTGASGAVGGAFRITTLTPESLAAERDFRPGRRSSASTFLRLLRRPRRSCWATFAPAAMSSGSAARTSSRWPTTP